MYKYGIKKPLLSTKPVPVMVTRGSRTEPGIDPAVRKIMGTEGSTDKTDIMSSISSWKDKRSARGTSSEEGEEGNHDKKRVSTGIPDLDLLLEGGFLVGKSYLVTGEQGSGKTIFCIQFILSSLLAGEKAVYVTVNEKPADIVAEANSLGWSLLKFVEEKKLLILDASPLLSIGTSRAPKSEGLDVAKTVSDLANYVKRMEASRVVIDPVGPLIGSNDSSPTTQEHIRTLVHALQDNLETTNLLASNSFSGNSIGAAGGQGIPVNGVVVLGFSRKKKGLIRTLFVSKMRGTAIDLIEYPFDIVKERGIVLRAMIQEVSPTPETPTISVTPAPETPEAGLDIFKEWEP